MKKLHKFIISSYLGPFFATFFIAMFILLMQFLWKYIDDLVGKGLEMSVFVELLFYVSAGLIPMALPLAILLSSIMTFGNLGEHYELVALKSAGISLPRIMFPLIVVTFFVSILAFYFSNNILPIANLKAHSLLWDIRQKKPAFDIKPGVFYDKIEGYVIRVNKKDKEGHLEDIMIYDHSESDGNKRVTVAKKGKMDISKDTSKLVLTLKDGVAYDELEPDLFIKSSRPMLKDVFQEQTVIFDLLDFKLSRTKEELFKSNFQMMSLSQLAAAQDTLSVMIEKRLDIFANSLQSINEIKHINDKNYKPNPDTTKLKIIRNPVEPLSIDKNFEVKTFLNQFDKTEKQAIVNMALDITRSLRNYTLSMIDDYENERENLARYKIEWNRKFTLSFACIVLFFIGAPLGAIIRKGGLGMPLVVSVLFFLLYHVLSITGEKMAREGVLEAYQGMWLATSILLPLGIFLTYKAANDSTFLSIDSYTAIFNKIKRLFKMSKTKQ